MYLNKVLLIGNLTRDPELRAIPSGTKVVQLGIATNRTWKDQSGARKEATEFHNVVAFGRQAETLAQYCKKGSSLYIEGRMQTRSWEGQDGKKNYRTEIVLENFQFGPKAGGSAGGSTGNYGQGGQAGQGGSSAVPARQSGGQGGGVSDAEAPQKEAGADLDTIEYPDEEINLEDIPF